MPTVVATGTFTIVDIADGGQRNLLDPSTWVVGTSGNQIGFTEYGLDGCNIIELGIDPYGRSNPLWKCLDIDTAATNDGGFLTEWIPIDANRTYRFMVFCKRLSSDGHYYFGLHSNGSVHALTLAGADDTNPYFWTGDSPEADRWYLSVGYVHGSGTSVSLSMGGVYDMVTGAKIRSCVDFKWIAGTSQARLRTFLLNSAILNNAAWLWNPSIELCDGTEEPIESIIAARASDYQIGQMASDSIITPQEKTGILGRWCEIVNDVAITTAIPTAYNGTVGDGRFKTLRDKSYALGIWTPTTPASAAKNFYDAVEGLRAYLFTSPAVILASTWSLNIAVVKTTWLTLWMTYASTADALQAACTAASQAGTIKYLTSLATSGDFTEQLGIYLGQVYRWSGTAWVNQDATVPADPPAVFFSADDIEGNTLIDNSGRRRHGTIVDATAADGLIGGALSFNGSSAYVSGTYPDASAFTLAALVQRSGTGATQDIVYIHREAALGRLLLRISAATIQAVCVDAASVAQILTGPASTTAWTYIVATHNGSTLKLYVDGALAGSLACTLNASYYNLLKVGMNGSVSGYYFQGLIDEALVYPRALSDSEVLGLYLTKTIQKRYTKSDFLLEAMADDGLITPAEKTAKVMDWCAIIDTRDMTTAVPTDAGGTVAAGRFKALRDQSVAVGIWTPTTAGSAVKNFYDAVEALRSYLFVSPGVFLSSTWTSIITIAKATWTALWAAVNSTGEALQSAIAQARAAQVPKYLGRFSTSHPTPRNDGDSWLMYDPANLRGVWYDDLGTATRIDSETTDQLLLAKLVLALPDVAWAEKNAYGVSEDYGYGTIYQDIASVRALINQLMANDIYLTTGGQIRSGGYLEDGSNPNNAPGILIKADGSVLGRGAVFETIEAVDGVFKGALDSPLLKTSKAISAQTASTPAKTWWGFDELFALFTCGYGTFSTSGTYNGQAVNSITFNSKSGVFIKYDTTIIDSFTFFGAPRNYTFSIYEPGTSTLRESSSIGSYFQGSAWINALQNAGLPMSTDITVSNSSFGGKTITKLNYSPSSIVLTGTGAEGTITISAAGFYSYTGSLAIPAQGDEKLLIQGIVEATKGTVKAEAAGSNSDYYIRFADGTQICWRTFVAPSSGEIIWNFPAAFANANYALSSTSLRNSESNAMITTIVRSAGFTQVWCRIVYGENVAGEPTSLMVIGRWK